MTSVAILKRRMDRYGGLEKVARLLAKSFKSKGCSVQVLTSGVDSPEDGWVNLTNQSSLSVIDMQRFDRRCRDWLKQNPTDIVFGLDRNSCQTHYRAGNGCHAAYLEHRAQTDSRLKQLSFKVNPLHRSILNFERRTFESDDLRALVTNSAMVRDEILSHYKVDPSKIHVVHNGVEWAEYGRDFNTWHCMRDEIRDEYDMSPSAFQFLFIGNGYRRKGLLFLMQALSKLRERDFELTVVGKDKELQQFQRLSRSLGLERFVRFLGPQTPKQIHRLYQASDSLAIPSTYDPFANVTVEALAMGLFVVSSKFNGGSEVLNSTNGSVIENLVDPDSVAKSLSIALDHPKNTETSASIRSGVSHLDASKQLNRIIDLTLATK